jgi:beta-xylosidase
MRHKLPLAVLGLCLLIGFALAGLSGAAPGSAAPSFISKVWVADNGDGSYKNPVLHADYSDPDPVRVDDDYYMVASSFTCVPGIPVLHSRDLVNWEIIGHVYPKQPPYDAFRLPRHGGGAWAPSIRYHDGQFWVFYPDPDFGIYVSKASNPAGPWSEPHLVKEVKGWIDPCPLWDDDGKAYLVTGFARSRSGVYSTLAVSRMSPDGSRLLDEGALIFDGHGKHPTVEGPKLYKRGGYYYVFAPAGGVATGWQLVLRSTSIYGPYEERVVLSQGKTAINGPHQGGWVDTPFGEYWFLHFQDKGAYGRTVHLQPMRWQDGWPVIGDNGEPVLRWAKPITSRPGPIQTPLDSDEFNQPEIGPQWQWQANPQPGWALPSPALGALRLYCARQPQTYRNLADLPNLLLQKFPAPEFTATAKLKFTPVDEGDKTGLIVFGEDYAYISLQKRADKLEVSFADSHGATRGAVEQSGQVVPAPSATAYLRVHVSPQAQCQFSYSFDGAAYTAIGTPFRAVKGAWIGAKIGLFATQKQPGAENGYADFDWFRVE